MGASSLQTPPSSRYHKFAMRPIVLMAISDYEMYLSVKHSGESGSLSALNSEFDLSSCKIVHSVV